MKSFFTTAVLAATANAMSATEVGDLLAGIFYEVGIDSSLTDMTECMADGFTIEQDVSDAIAKFEEGGPMHIYHGVKELIDGVREIPEAFHGCTHMTKDLEAVGDWLSIVAHPKELLQKVERNTALHILQLKKDISALKTDMSAQNYFKAGKDIGDILVAELGKAKLPSQSAENITIPKLYDVAEFVSGVLYGITEDGNLTDLSECMVDADKVEKDVSDALGKLFHGHIHDAVADLSAAVALIPASVSTCEGTGADLKALEQWLSIVKDKDALKKKIEKNTALHLLKIKRDISTAKSDISSHEYFQAGETAADILILELGKPTAPATFTSLGFSFDDATNLIAGLIFGLVGDNELPEIQTCMGDITNLQTDVETAIADFNKGTYQDTLNGLYQVGLALQALPSDFTNCSSGLQDDLARIQTWSKIFIEPVQLAETVGKNLVSNPIKAERDLHKAKNDLHKPDYYAFGEDVADILTLAVGPVPAAYFLQ